MGRNQKNFGLWSLITKADLVRKHPAERPVSSGPYYVHITYTPCCVYVHRTRYLLNSFSFSNAICCVRESRDSNSCVSCSLKIFEIKAVIWRNRIYDVSKKGNKGPPKFGFWECQKIIVKKKKKMDPPDCDSRSKMIDYAGLAIVLITYERPRDTLIIGQEVTRYK